MKPLPWLVALGALAFGLAAMPITAATPPPNDNRANAQILTLPAQVAGTTVGATTEASDPQCQPKVRETVWYKLSRTVPGPILVGLQAMGDLDAVVAAYEVQKNQLKLRGCEPTDKSGRALFSFESNPPPKTTLVYLFVVGQQLNSDPGDFTLTVKAPARPTNDERPGAVPLEKLPASVWGTTVGATADEGDPDCGEGGPSVWYRLSRAEKSRLTIRFSARGNLEAGVCAVLKVRSQLRVVAGGETDDKGDAAFAFDGDKGALYYLVVSQAYGSEPGAFRILASSPARPANDELVQATAMAAPPSTLQGTTAGATHDAADPGCGEKAGPTVWYRLDWKNDSLVVLRVHAQGDLDAAVCVAEPVREKARTPVRRLEIVESGETDKRGDAQLVFEGKPGGTYYVVVTQLGAMAPGPFRLAVLKPDDPPVAPGTPLRGGSGRGFLHPLLDPNDAWAVPLQKGASYRLTIVNNSGRCLSLAVYRPRTRSFDEDPAIAVDCAEESVFFTPGPDGGGIYPVLLTAKSRPTAYRLYVSRVQADDTGPGVLIENGKRVNGSVSPGDPLDLYRFDVTTRSNVQIEASSLRDVGIQLKDSEGHTFARVEPGTTMTRVLGTGTYYVAIRAEERTAKYALRVLVRYVTATTISVDGGRSVRIKPGVTVSVQTLTEPDPGPGTTRVQADFFDVATGTWVFRQLWDVTPGSTISFTPSTVGRWRVRATFNGNRLASGSRSGYGTIIVATV